MLELEGLVLLLQGKFRVLALNALIFLSIMVIMILKRCLAKNLKTVLIHKIAFKR
jgi:hypothetical protein